MLVKMKISLIVILSLFVLTVSAQKAKISGIVKDAKSGELLFGTNVFIQGTTIGAMSDFDGHYSLELEKGTYTLVCSFVSYESQKIEITVKAGESKSVNFSLKESTLQLQDVQVSAKRVERTEAAVTSMQKKAAGVISGISSQEILKAGAGDAASALKKVTGVTVQGGKYVFVRGLSDRYSKTTLNGAEIPGLDPERNTVQMDLFPSNILENMLVFKSFQADLPGDFTGGLIDIKTKDFPDKFTLGFSAEVGYNPQSNLIDNFITHQGGGLDFLGIDDGQRALPVEAEGVIPYRGQGQDAQLNTITKSFNKDWETYQKTSGLNQKYTFNIGDNSKIGKKELGYSLAGTYSNQYQFDDNMSFGRYELVSSENTSLNPISASNQFSSSIHESIWSLMGVLGFKINDKNNLGLSIINNHKGAQQTSYLLFQNFKNGQGEYRERRVLEFSARNLLVAQLKGNHEMGTIKTSWVLSASNASQNEPDVRFLTNQREITSTDTLYYIDASTIQTPRRFYRTMSENVWFARLDFEKGFKLMGADSKLKFGLTQNYKQRSYLQKQIGFYEAQSKIYQNIFDFFDDSNIDATTGIRAQGSIKEDEKNSYNGTQSISSGYIMGDLPLYEKYRLLLGARVEKVDMLTESLRKQVGTQDNKGTLNEWSVLPSVSFTYMPTEKTNWRLAYSRTVARPSFREKSPMAIESKTGDIVIGNINLQQTDIDNLDFRWEHYFKAGEALSLGGFYKHFSNPIEKTFNTKAQNPELTWRNVPKAQMWGVEIEFSKKLDFISLLKDFKISTNFTYVYSQVDIDPQELEIKKVYDPNIASTRFMTEQSPFVFNALLAYKTDSSKWDVNLSYTYNAKTLVLINPTGIPDVYQSATNELNFNVSKGFGKHISVQFSIKNILDDRTNRYYEYMESEYIYENYGWGRTFVLKLSYNL
jgi:TonB-dependent receptor